MRWAWPVAIAAAAGVSAMLAIASPTGGNIAFVAGAIAIVVSIGFIGLGGNKRFRILRDLRGAPIAREPVEPQKRAREIQMGVGIFLVGLAIWAPLLVLAFR